METLPNLPFSQEQLEDALKKNHVTIRQHPTEKLYVFNYTPLVQYHRHWHDVTKTCRGLILDDEYNIVARPFQKIFNYTEIVPDHVIFNQPPVITEKMDGSLGIVYKSDKGWAIATRGSFTSDQALWATEWFNKRFPKYDQPENVTTLVEIIYPDNRICVNYGAKEDLVLIAAMNNLNGSDFPLQSVNWWGGSVVERVFGASDIDDVYRLATSNDYENKEGVVCTWFKYHQPSFRLKVKHPEYVRLHKIIHSFSEKKVWEALSQGKELLDLLDDVPDEFYDTVKKVMIKLFEDFAKIEVTAQQEYAAISHLTSRKLFAEAAKETTYPAIMFRMEDGKPWHDIVWKLIKPKGEL